MNPQNIRLALIALLYFSFAIRFPALFFPHHENDEIIYKTLADKVLVNPLDYSLRGTNLLSHLPQTYNSPVFNHPPLFVYGIALLKFLIGDYGQILLPIISAILTIFLTYLIGRKLYSQEHGILAAAILSFCPMFLTFSDKLWIEVPVTFFITWTFYLFLIACERKQWSLFLFAGIIWGLALLTKHTALGILPVLIYLLGRSKIALNKTIIYFGMFLSLAIVINIPWFTFYHLLTGHFLYADRYTNSVESMALFKFTKLVLTMPSYYYLTVFLIYPIYIFSFIQMARTIYRRQNLSIALWGMFFVGSFVFFGQIKLLGVIIRYLTPALPALALLAADFFIPLINSPIGSMAREGVLILLIFFLAFGLATGLINMYFYDLSDAYPLSYFWRIFNLIPRQFASG